MTSIVGKCSFFSNLSGEKVPYAEEKEQPLGLLNHRQSTGLCSPTSPSFSGAFQCPGPILQNAATGFSNVSLATKHVGRAKDCFVEIASGYNE
jgi:hypothetical protein